MKLQSSLSVKTFFSSIPQRYEIVNLVQVTCSNVNVITQKCSNIHLFVCVFMNILV